jgi:uncharacterized membrane protein YfcA
MHELAQIDLGRVLLLAALAAAGVVAGFFNTVAGAGSLLTVPVLLLVGMPADAANATNRIGVMAQSTVGVVGFARADVLDGRALGRTAPAAIVGGLVGAWLSTLVPPAILKWILLATLLEVAFVIVRKRATAGAERPAPGPVRTALLLFGAGLYGGFAQAGVGLVLLAILARAMQLDLVRANALKVAIVGLFTIAALVVFARAGTIRWFEGAVLAAGMVVGAAAAVRFAVKKSASLERAAVVAVVVAVAAVIVREVVAAIGG